MALVDRWLAKPKLFVWLGIGVLDRDCSCSRSARSLSMRAWGYVDDGKSDQVQSAACRASTTIDHAGACWPLSPRRGKTGTPHGALVHFTFLAALAAMRDTTYIHIYTPLRSSPPPPPPPPPRLPYSNSGSPFAFIQCFLPACADSALPLALALDVDRTI